MAAGAVLSGCSPGAEDQPTRLETEPTTQAGSPALDPSADAGEDFADAFVDRAAALGLDFRHDSGARGDLWMPETLGSGVGLVDYDSDGDLDVYLVQGGWLDERNERGFGWRARRTQ